MNDKIVRMNIIMTIIVLSIFIIPGSVWQWMLLPSRTGRDIAEIVTGIWLGVSIVIAFYKAQKIWK